MPSYKIEQRSPDRRLQRTSPETSPNRYSRASWHSGSTSTISDHSTFSSPGSDNSSVFRHVLRPVYSSRQRTSREMNAPLELMHDAMGVLEGFFTPPRRRPGPLRNSSSSHYSRTDTREPSVFIYISDDDTPRSRPRSSGGSHFTSEPRHSRRHEREFDDRSTASRHSHASRSTQAHSTGRRHGSPSRRRPEIREISFDVGSSHSHRSRPSRRHTHESIDRLEYDAHAKRRAVRSCRRQIEQALQDPVDSRRLQHLLEDLRKLKTASGIAEERLQEARQGLRNPRDAGNDDYSHWGRSSRKPRGNSDDDGWDSFEDPGPNFFADLPDLPGDFTWTFEAHSGPHRSRSRQPATRDFFRAPRAGSRAPSPSRNARPRSSAPKASVRPTRPGSTTWLQPLEAQSLYATYNARWKALMLDPDNPDIPYPARGLRSIALTARDTLAMPSMHPSTLARASNDAVMQGNVQAFFLGAAGIIPAFAERHDTGIMEVAIDWARVPESLRRTLVEILKREKFRWHSDRLGRRNGGTSMINTALQQDERARAVFHAVCALMDKIDGK